MANIHKQLYNHPKIKSSLSNMGVASNEDLNMFSLLDELRKILIKNIHGANNMPQGIKSKLISSILNTKLSETHGYVSLTCVRDSIYTTLNAIDTEGLKDKRGDADLALVYNDTVHINKNAIVKTKDKSSPNGIKIIGIGKDPRFSHEGSFYLEKTCEEFMAKYPYCTVELVKNR